MAGFLLETDHMSDQPLIEIRVKLSSGAHKLLTRRARQLGRDRDVEAGRLLNRMLLEIIASAERRRAIGQRVAATTDGES